METTVSGVFPAGRYVLKGVFDNSGAYITNSNGAFHGSISGSVSLVILFPSVAGLMGVMAAMRGERVWLRRSRR